MVKPLYVRVDRPRSDRQNIWRKIRELKSFSRGDLIAALQGSEPVITHSVVDKYLSALTCAGILTTEGACGSRLYVLTNDRGVEAPRIRADGSSIANTSREEMMWRAMRITRLFTARDLTLYGTEEMAISIGQSRTYLEKLFSAGYLIALGARGDRRRADDVTYRLCRDTGPLPPSVHACSWIYDPNLDAVASKSGVSHG